MVTSIGEMGHPGWRTPTPPIINHSTPSQEMIEVANQVAKIVYAKDTDIESENHAKRMAQEFADYAARLTKEKKYSEIEAEGISLRRAGISFHLLAKYFNFYGYTVYVTRKHYRFLKLKPVNWESFAMPKRRRQLGEVNEIDRDRREHFLITHS